MRAILALSSLFLVAGACSPERRADEVPSAEQIDRVETALSRSPCIGDLAQWERNYRYSRKAGMFFWHSINPDLEVIEMHLRQAGTVAVRPGRAVVEPSLSRDWPDIKGIRAIDGRFWLGNGRLQLRGCPRAR